MREGDADGAHHLRPLVRASASIRSRKSRSTSSIPGSSVLSFGTAGCNLACKFCQNWDISKSQDMDRLRTGERPSRSPRAALRAGLQSRRLHLQRPGDLRRVRDGRRRRLPRGGVQDGGGHRGLHARRAAARVLRQDGRGQRGPQGVHRGVLLQAHRRASAAGARDARLSEARDRGLVRDHHAADSGQERHGRGNRGRVPLDRARNSGRTCRCISRRSIRTGR